MQSFREIITFFHKLVKKDNNNILTTFSKTSSGTFRVTLATLRADEWEKISGARVAFKASEIVKQRYK